MSHPERREDCSWKERKTPRVLFSRIGYHGIGVTPVSTANLVLHAQYNCLLKKNKNKKKPIHCVPSMEFREKNIYGRNKTDTGKREKVPQN